MAAPADQILIVLVSALVGYGGKWAWDWRTARRAEKKEDQALWSLHNQQFHLPLLDAGQQLQARLCELSDIYTRSRASTRLRRCPVISVSSTS